VDELLHAVVRHRIGEPSMDALCDQTPGERIGPRDWAIPIPPRVAVELRTPTRAAL